MDGHRPGMHTVSMTIEAWWPKLRPATRDWLIANNGDVVPAPILEEIAAAGGPSESEGWWVAQEGGSGSCMPDEGVDWIEEMANEETPAS